MFLRACSKQPRNQATICIIFPRSSGFSQGHCEQTRKKEKPPNSLSTVMMVVNLKHGASHTSQTKGRPGKFMSEECRSPASPLVATPQRVHQRIILLRTLLLATGVCLVISLRKSLSIPATDEYGDDSALAVPTSSAQSGVQRMTLRPRTATRVNNTKSITSSLGILVANSSVTLSTTKNATLPPCTVAVLNTQDYHYEILESIVLRYPLPWHKLQCDATSQPIVFDMALRAAARGVGELDGWAQYFTNHLAGTTRLRADGTTAQFGKRIRFRQVLGQQNNNNNNNHHYSAEISATCFMDRLHKWMISGPRQHRRFCVQHTACPHCTPTQLAQSCWLNPMHPCFFLPLDLPQFPVANNNTAHCPNDNKNNNNNQQQQQQTTTTRRQDIRLCVSGGSRRHDILATALRHLRNHPNNNNDVQVWIHKRKPGLPPEYYNNSSIPITNIRVVRERDFLAFQKSMASCDLMLPLLDPQTNDSYFLLSSLAAGHHHHHTHQKLSGSLAQAMAYQLPTVLHQDLHRIYEPYWTSFSTTTMTMTTAPIWTHDSTQASFEMALTRALTAIRREKQQQQQQQRCQ